MIETEFLIKKYLSKFPLKSNREIKGINPAWLRVAFRIIYPEELVNFLNKYRVVIETKFPRVLRLLRALLIISPRRCVKSHERNINGINKLSGLTRMTAERGKVKRALFPSRARKRSGFLLRTLHPPIQTYYLKSFASRGGTITRSLLSKRLVAAVQQDLLLAPSLFLLRQLFVSIAIRIDSFAIPCFEPSLYDHPMSITYLYE